MTTTKKVVRRSAPFASFQKFLVSETGVGNISRQEAVSMIPPLLMDVKPHMTVLDLCAAPGSKAAQLIEMVHAGEESRVRAHLSEVASTTMDDAQDGAGNGTELEENVFDHGRSTGLLIANDADYKRSHLLVHQMKRLNSPNLIITNHDATMFPSIRLPGQKGYLKFDRILADVPCSGDGTPRKNPNVWKDWSPANGVGLHLTQVRILVRALQMLKVGGRVVYSTCSMNPVENEAVVATAIDRCGGLSRVKIIDCDAELPKLKRSPGLNDWNVMDKSGRVWHNWKEVEEEKNRDKAHGLDRLVKGMFPPSRGRDENEGENEQIPLHRCLRVHAHLQDTGAFFITVLEKLSEIRLRPESEPKRRGPKPPVIALAEEISARSENAASSTSEPLEVEELQTLNDLVPIQEDLSVNASAAARQNRDDVLPQRQNATVKRDRDPSYDAGDAAMTSKRSRTRDEPDDLATKEDEDRHTHLPPSPAAQPHEAQTASPLVVSSKKKTRQPFEEPFKYLPMDHDELNIIYDFYDISPEFPRDRFMVRNLTGEPAKAIYYTAGFARDILTDNEGKGLKFVHCGVKMFVKQDIQKHGICKWRIQTEGLSILEPWVGEKRVVRLHKQETLKKLLVEMFPKVSDYGWRELGEIGERVRDIELGCCVLRIEPSDAPDGFRYESVLEYWDCRLIQTLGNAWCYRYGEVCTRSI